MAWTADNEVSKRAGQKVRLFKTTWVNPFPDTEIESLDYVSKMTTVAPFLVPLPRNRTAGYFPHWACLEKT
jgi:hypothetical protein